MDKSVPETPLTPEQLTALHRIARARSYMLVCFLTLPLYVAGLLLLLNGGRGISTLMFAYMGVYTVFAVNMAVRRCPRCHRQFFVRHVFLNLFARHCAHCGLQAQTRHREKF